MLGLELALAAGLSILTLDDEECRLLFAGTGGKAEVVSEAVDLGKEPKPFRCEKKGSDRMACLSSRSGKTSEFLIEHEDKDKIVLRHDGKGEWAAVVRVETKTGRFVVSSSRPMGEKGLVSELCVGKATLR